MSQALVLDHAIGAGGARSDADGRAALGPDLMELASTECLHAPDGIWGGLSRTLRVACGGEAAGVALPTGRTEADDGAPPYAALVRHVGHERREVVWTEDDGDACCAAIAVTGAVRTGFLWVRGRAPLSLDQLHHLRSIAAFAQLLWALDEGRERAELLLQESQHRAANDLQMVGGLLSHQARLAGEAEAAAALAEVAGRVLALARTRQAPAGNVVEALRATLAALRAQVDDRRIALTLHVTGAQPVLDERCAAALVIGVNELATNAIRHAFQARRGGGVLVAVRFGAAGVHVSVADDGAPLPPDGASKRPGSGLDLIARLIAGAGGALRLPTPATKTFTFDLPFHAGEDRRRPKEKTA